MHPWHVGPVATVVPRLAHDCDVEASPIDSIDCLRPLNMHAHAVFVLAVVCTLALAACTAHAATLPSPARVMLRGHDDDSSTSTSFTTSTSTTGPLVLVGGELADDNALIYGKIVELAGGKGSARMCVVTAASEDPLGSWVIYQALFQKYGVASVQWLPVDLAHKANNSNPVL